MAKEKTKTITKKIDKEKAKEYELMGKQLEDLYASVSPKRGALYKAAFIKGVLGGVGGVIGATVVIALLLWVLSLFENIPLIGDFIDSIRGSIEEG